MTTDNDRTFSWNWLLFHPPVAHTDDVMIDASLRLPLGWKFGTRCRPLRHEVNGARPDGASPPRCTRPVKCPVTGG